MVCEASISKEIMPRILNSLEAVTKRTISKMIMTNVIIKIAAEITYSAV